MKRPKLIYLKWVDAHTNTAGWRTQEEAELWADGTDWLIEECGWLVKETKEYVAIATALKPESDVEEKQYLNLHKIPNGWIRERRVVVIKKEKNV